MKRWRGSVFLVAAVVFLCNAQPSYAGYEEHDSSCNHEPLPLGSYKWHDRYGAVCGHVPGYEDQYYYFYVDCVPQDYNIYANNEPGGRPIVVGLYAPVAPFSIDHMVIDPGDAAYMMGTLSTSGCYSVKVHAWVDSPLKWSHSYIKNGSPPACHPGTLGPGESHSGMLIYNDDVSYTYQVQITENSNHLWLDNQGAAKLCMSFYVGETDFDSPQVYVEGEYYDDLHIIVSSFDPGTYYCEVAILGEVEEGTSYTLTHHARCDPSDLYTNDPCAFAQYVNLSPSGMSECVDTLDEGTGITSRPTAALNILISSPRRSRATSRCMPTTTAG